MKKFLSVSLCILVTLLSTSSVSVSAENANTFQVCKYDYETATTELITIERTDDTFIPGLDIGDTSVSPRVVIGADGRIKLSSASATVNPFRKIVCLYTYIDSNGDGTADKLGLGTGAMVSSTAVLTAAHCHKYKENGNLCETVATKVHWYQNSSTLNDNSCNIVYWWLADGYDVDDGAHENDWAVAKLDEAVGSSTGYFSTAIVTDSTLKNAYLTTVGYPSEDTYYMYKSQGQLIDEEEMTEATFRHNMDTSEGHSGSPIYDTSSHVLYGIHVAGDGTGESDGVGDYNIAIRIDSEILSTIKTVTNLPI